MADLLLQLAAAAPGEVYDVLSGSRIVGRILPSDASAASQSVWTLSYDYHEDRTPTHGIGRVLSQDKEHTPHSPPIVRRAPRSPIDLVGWLAG